LSGGESGGECEGGCGEPARHQGRQAGERVLRCGVDEHAGTEHAETGAEVVGEVGVGLMGRHLGGGQARHDEAGESEVAGGVGREKQGDKPDRQRGGDGAAQGRQGAQHESGESEGNAVNRTGREVGSQAGDHGRHGQSEHGAEKQDGADVPLGVAGVEDQETR
jgi:hypothetical protein